MLKRFLECGKIVTTHGIKGEVKVYPYADSPDFITGFDTLFLDGGRQSLEVRAARVQKNVAIVHFAGYETQEMANTLRGKMLYVDRDDIELLPGEYFVQDLLGLRAIDADSGRDYGVISEVSPTGANDVYHLMGDDGRERLIPAIPNVIDSVDFEAGTIKIRPLPGLFDDED